MARDTRLFLGVFLALPTGVLQLPFFLAPNLAYMSQKNKNTKTKPLTSIFSPSFSLPMFICYIQCSEFSDLFGRKNREECINPSFLKVEVLTDFLKNLPHFHFQVFVILFFIVYSSLEKILNSHQLSEGIPNYPDCSAISSLWLFCTLFWDLNYSQSSGKSWVNQLISDSFNFRIVKLEGYWSLDNFVRFLKGLNQQTNNGKNYKTRHPSNDWHNMLQMSCMSPVFPLWITNSWRIGISHLFQLYISIKSRPKNSFNA